MITRESDKKLGQQAFYVNSKDEIVPLFCVAKIFLESEIIMKNASMYCLVFFFIFSSSIPSSSAVDAYSPEETASGAVGLALAKVEGIQEKDQRPVDGNLLVCVSLKVEKGSGKILQEFSYPKAFGGRRFPGFPEPKPPELFTKKELKVEGRYWFLFAPKTEQEKYPGGIIDFWSADDPAVQPLFQKWLSEDQFKGNSEK